MGGHSLSAFLIDGVCQKYPKFHNNMLQLVTVNSYIITGGNYE